jgi:hypothetical protein
MPARNRFRTSMTGASVYGSGLVLELPASSARMVAVTMPAVTRSGRVSCAARLRVEGGQDVSCKVGSAVGSGTGLRQEVRGGLLPRGEDRIAGMPERLAGARDLKRDGGDRAAIGESGFLQSVDAEVKEVVDALRGIAAGPRIDVVEELHLRFPAPLPAGSKIRVQATLTDFKQTPLGLLASIRLRVEIEGQAKAACIADTLSLYVG